MSLIYNQSLQPTELILTALSWLDAGHRIALVTLVNIEGNAPYPVGSQMLVNDQGRYVGQITGGCAETAIADQAVSAMNNDENRTLRYGLDSPFFDIQLPCGSGIDVYFDCDITNKRLSQIASHLNERKSFVEILETGVGKFERHYLPSKRLIIFGQGPILVLLAELATKSGFDVACVAQNEHTEALLSAANLKSVSLSEARSNFASNLDEFGAMVSLFHEHDLEVDLLAEALNTKAFYIGALGSKRTHNARLESLRNHGVDQLLLSKIHGPVGLDIGANTPAQIAVSILAEVIEQLNVVERGL